MRIELPKNKQVDKQEPRINKNESSVFNSANQLKTFDSPPAPTTGAFAKILEEARKDSKTDKNGTTAEKNTNADNTSETSKSDKDKELARYTREKDELEKDGNSQKQNHSGQENDGENPSAALNFLSLQPNVKTNSEVSIPAARSILHVADLERIISAIRTENFKNSQQALISLKNSVLEGLQIRISLNENGKLKAEFLALNKQIKKQLDARKNELSDIFRNRSLNLAEISVLLTPTTIPE